MIDFRNVSLGYGGQTVLSDVSFRIHPGEHVGIVGPNGAGKTTVFSLLTGELSPDRGEIVLPRSLQVGYLHQQVSAASTDRLLLEHAEDAVPAVQAAQREMETLEADLPSLQGADRDKALRRLGEVQSHFEALHGYELRTRAQAALCGLGFSPGELHQPLASFSGGWQMRAELARILVARPDLLLLDEPTNYLDIPAVEWLQRFLREFPGTLLLISHDRYLLTTLTSVTLEVVCGRVTRYPGNYDVYAHERRRRHEQIQAARRNQDRRREQVERFVERFRAKNTKSSQVQSRIKMLEKMEEEDIAVPPAALPRARIRVARPPPSGLEVMRLDDAGVTYDGARWVLRGLNVRTERGEKTALVGLNGTGKTTLLRLMAGRLPLSEGRRIVGHKVVIGYQTQDFADSLDAAQSVLESAKSASCGQSEGEIRTALGGFFFSGDAVEKKVAVLSGGEKMRLAFVRLLLNPPNFLLLDEPTTHLDIAARESLESALRDYQGTLYLVSHDIEFVRKVATSILVMTPPTVRRYLGGYDDYREKAAAEAAAAGIAAPGPAGVATPEDTRKTLRRERALRRQELSRLRRPIEAEVRTIEAAIAKLEAEQSTLTESLATPGACKDFAGTGRRLHDIEEQIRALTEAWERASLRLESVPRD